MTTLTRRARRIAVAVAGLAAVCALTVPAAAARASTRGYTPSSNEWWMANWDVPQKVWPVTEGSGVTVAVVDSGVQASERDLQGVVKPGADELGDSGNGEHDYAPNDGHGTAVAALIAGQGADTGTVGIAPQAKILPVHAIDPSAGMAPVANGIKYAVDHGADVINLSVGAATLSATQCDPAVQDAVSYALKHNVVVVAGAGDANLDGPRPEEPASCAGVLAVGGVESNGSLWSHSVQQPYVSVAAPADHMVYVGADGRFTTIGAGNSFSAPLVSGAAALIRSKYPSMPWYQVDQRLIDTAIPDGQVPNDGTGYGIIDINKALSTSPPASGPNPPYRRYQTWLKSTGQSGGQGAQAAPSASGESSGGLGTLFLIIGIVAVVLIVAAIVIIVLVTRGRNRRGPRNPGGGYPLNAYGLPPGQYPQPGPYAPPPGQYPPPSGQQYPPPNR